MPPPGDAPLPNLSRLATATTSQPVDTLITWNVASSELVASYFAAVASAISKHKSTEHDESCTASKRKRPSDAATLLEYEHQAHLQWLRLCKVPSEPCASDRVCSIESGSEQHYTNALQRARALLANSAAAGGPAFPVVDADVAKIIQHVVRSVNSHQSTPQHLAPPPFQTLNASGRAKYESEYIDRLRAVNKSVDAFTNAPLLVTGGATAPVAHIVPKAWTRPVSALAEFVGVDGDPTNVVTTFNLFNTEMGPKAVYLGKLAHGRFNDGKYWSPINFGSKNRAAVARSVACVALTYPFLSADDTSVRGRPVGLPLYASQINSIVDLLAEEPDLEDYTLAWIQFATFGWLNPLVVSKKTRQEVRRKNTALGNLLRKRLAGSDLGTLAAVQALKDTGVQFDRP